MLERTEKLLTLVQEQKEATQAAQTKIGNLQALADISKRFLEQLRTSLGASLGASLGMRFHSIKK